MHYVKRFFTSLFAKSLSDREVDWVRSHLTEDEFGLWQRHSRQDKRHTYVVAARVASQSQDSQSAWRINAALMHDVGKLTCDLSTLGRVFATLAIELLGRRKVSTWQDFDGIRGQWGRYCAHPALGSVLLSTTNSDPRVAIWAGEHHLSAKRWTIPYEDGKVLKTADHA
jgi:hypothetical protein